MTAITLEAARSLLCDLVALPTVNPMGRVYTANEPVERPAIEYIRELFRPYDVKLATQACSPHHESLLVELPGRRPSPFLLLESHVDTVPADDWSERAFVPRVVGNRLFGRGACDDKGPLVAMILAVREVLEGGRPPCRPVLFLAAGDEEYAQTGIRHFAAQRHDLYGAVCGEPTQLSPIIQHKGTVRWDITVHGKSAHSSQPELGRDAIRGAVQVMEAIGAHERRLRERHQNPRMTGPSLTVTMIQGGRTRNAVADQCTLSVDFRVLPRMQPAQARAELIEVLATLGLEVTHGETQLMTPPLDTDPEDAFAQRVRDVCRRLTGRRDIEFAGAPYGTDAAWISDRAPAAVLGPGSIDSAHAVDEHVDLDEVVSCARIYHEIVMSET